MNTGQLPRISVTEPVGRAIEWVKVMLFRPFDLGKWFTVGFCAWLALLQRGGFYFNFPIGRRHKGPDVGPYLEEGKKFIIANLPLVIVLGMILAVLIMIVFLVLLWLSSRGQFMYLDCVARNKGEVTAPWHKFKREGNSLFLFRLTLLVIGFACLMVFGLSAFLFGRMIHLGCQFNAMPFTALVINVIVLVVLAIAFILANKFTLDFVAPIMYLGTVSCVKAWGQFWALLAANAGKFILYILFQIVIAMCIGAIILAVICITCCIAGCIIAIPYVGTVLILPLLVFQRSYSLFYIRQYGAAYDVFARPEPQSIVA